MTFIYRVLSKISAVALLSTVVLLILVIYITHEVRLARNIRLLHELEPFADRIERLFVGALRNTSYQLGFIAKQVSLEQARREDIEEIFHSFDQTGEDLENGEMVMVPLIWMNPDNAVEASTLHQPDERPYAVSLREYIIKAKTHPFRMQLGKVRNILENDESGEDKMVLPVAMGVSGAKAVYLGSILSYISLRELVLKINNALRNPDLDFIIYDDDFDVILESAKKFRISSNPKLAKALKELIADGKKNGESRSSQLLLWGDRVLVYKLSKHNQFSIVVTINK